MSSSMELVGNRRFSGNKGFSLTCSRLSQYLKENGSFGDLSLGIACKPESNNGTFGMSRQPTTTMSLFPCEASNMAATEDVKPKDLFPRQQSSFSSSSSSVPKEIIQTTTTTRSVKPESHSAPLTIFYAGQVIVFNEFSAEKAKEIMDLATKGTANCFTSFTSNLNNHTPNLPKTQTEFRTQEPIQSIATPMACELPIARRASLHRFLEKRKDRVTSKAPYQLCDPSKASSKPLTGDDKTSWLGFAAQR